MIDLSRDLSVFKVCYFMSVCQDGCGAVGKQDSGRKRERQGQGCVQQQKEGETKKETQANSLSNSRKKV